MLFKEEKHKGRESPVYLPLLCLFIKELGSFGKMHGEEGPLRFHQ